MPSRLTRCPLPSESIAIATKTLPFAALCSTAFVAKTLPWPRCVPVPSRRKLFLYLLSPLPLRPTRCLSTVLSPSFHRPFTAVLLCRWPGSSGRACWLAAAAGRPSAGRRAGWARLKRVHAGRANRGWHRLFSGGVHRSGGGTEETVPTPVRLTLSDLLTLRP